MENRDGFLAVPIFVAYVKLFGTIIYFLHLANISRTRHRFFGWKGNRPIDTATNSSMAYVFLLKPNSS